MKTLREYIDQLDEISRRDFLKGAGATAGLAALGNVQAQQSRYTPTDIKIIKEGVEAYFYMISTEPTPPAKEIWGTQRTKTALQKIAKNPEGKKIINSTLQNLRKTGLSDETINDLFGFGPSSITKRIQKLEQLATVEDFSQGPAPTDQQLASVRQAMAMEEEQLEETPEDPIAKIDALFRDKQ
jgi:hypothetical protein